MENPGICPLDKSATAQGAAAHPGCLKPTAAPAGGACAIEVTVLFDDTVLEIRYLDRPSSGHGCSPCRALFDGASGLWLEMLTLFTSSQLQSSAGLIGPIPFQHAHADRQALAAAGLFLYRLGAFLYGRSRARRERRENEFSIGSDLNATFKMDSSGLPAQRFPLVRLNGTDYEFLFTDAMAGELQLDGQILPISKLSSRAQPARGIDGALAMTFPAGARVLLRYEGCTFLIRSVPAPRRIAMPLPFDWHPHVYTAVVMVGAALMLGLLFALPPSTRSLALNGLRYERLVRFLVLAPEEKAKPLPRSLQASLEHRGGTITFSPPAKAERTRRGCILICTSPSCGRASRSIIRPLAASDDGRLERLGSLAFRSHPKVKGNYEPSLIRRMFRLHARDIEDCYQNLLIRPSAKGGLVLRFVIGSQGNVLASAIAPSAAEDTTLKYCLADAVRDWHFPRPPQGPVSISYRLD